MRVAKITEEELDKFRHELVVRASGEPGRRASELELARAKANTRE